MFTRSAESPTWCRARPGLRDDLDFLKCIRTLEHPPSRQRNSPLATASCQTRVSRCLPGRTQGTACAPQAMLPSQAPFLLASSSEIASDRSHGAHGSLALGLLPSESPTPTCAPSCPCPQSPLPTLESSGRHVKGFWDQCLPSPSVEFGGKGTYDLPCFLGILRVDYFQGQQRNGPVPTELKARGSC